MTPPRGYSAFASLSLLFLLSARDVSSQARCIAAANGSTGSAGWSGAPIPASEYSVQYLVTMTSANGSRPIAATIVKRTMMLGIQAPPRSVFDTVRIWAYAESSSVSVDGGTHFSPTIAQSRHDNADTAYAYRNLDGAWTPLGASGDRLPAVLLNELLRAAPLPAPRASRCLGDSWAVRWNGSFDSPMMPGQKWNLAGNARLDSLSSGRAVVALTFGHADEVTQPVVEHRIGSGQGIVVWDLRDGAPDRIDVEYLFPTRTAGLRLLARERITVRRHPPVRPAAHP